MLVDGGEAEDVPLLPGNPVEELKSCGWINPSVGRLFFVSKSINHTDAVLMVQKDLYFSYPISRLVQVSSLLYDQERRYVINGHINEIYFHLVQLKMTNRDLDESYHRYLPQILRGSRVIFRLITMTQPVLVPSQTLGETVKSIQKISAIL